MFVGKDKLNIWILKEKLGCDQKIKTKKNKEFVKN